MGHTLEKTASQLETSFALRLMGQTLGKHLEKENRIPLHKLGHIWKQRAKLINGKQVTPVKEIGYTSKLGQRGSQLHKWATQITLKKTGFHLERWVTLEKIGSHSKNGVPVGKMFHSWETSHIK